MDKIGQNWTKLDKTGQNRTKVDKSGQATFTALYFYSSIFFYFKIYAWKPKQKQIILLFRAIAPATTKKIC